MSPPNTVNRSTNIRDYLVVSTSNLNFSTPDLYIFRTCADFIAKIKEAAWEVSRSKLRIEISFPNLIRYNSFDF
ncbi:MAG: hypothetical protein N2511_01135 [Thermodesulfovibrionales bacterium]|nr:hypothetical protein [Thermodesulfovibrionales bacterium]